MLKIKQLHEILKPVAAFIDWLNDGGVKKHSQGQLIGKKESQRGEDCNTKDFLEEKNGAGINQKSSIQTERPHQGINAQKEYQLDLHGQKKATLAEETSKKLSEGNESDFLLNVPLLNMQEIKMNVDNLNGRVALRADLANFIKIDIGAQVDIAKVDLDIKGIEVQAVCKVNLKQVYSIFTRALETIDKNSILLQNLLKPVEEMSGSETKDNFKATTKQGESASKKAETLDSAQADTVQGIKVQKKEIWDSIKDISKDVDRSLNVSNDISEKKRDKLIKVNKK